MNIATLQTLQTEALPSIINPALYAQIEAQNEVIATSFQIKASSFHITILWLLLCVLLSGLSIIYLADLNRQLSIALEEVKAQQIQLRQDWGKLLLEQSTWSTQARIQRIAQEQLGMQSPKSNQIVMIKTKGLL